MATPYAGKPKPFVKLESDDYYSTIARLEAGLSIITIETRGTDGSKESVAISPSDLAKINELARANGWIV